MDALPVNDVARTPSPFPSDEPDWVEEHRTHKGGLHGAGNRRTQIDFDSSGVCSLEHILSHSLDIL